MKKILSAVHARRRALCRLAWFALFWAWSAAALAPDEIDARALPREARAVLAAIRTGGPFAYAKDGVTFGNYERSLPSRKRGYYREYTVETPGARTRGARRVVCGAEGRDWARNAPAECYYTDDHYATFRRIRD